MGRLLEALRADSEKSQTAQPAIPAIPATRTPREPQRTAGNSGIAGIAGIAAARSCDSFDAIRVRLLALARAEGLPASVVDTIPADELPLYADTDDGSLRWCLRLRACCQLCGGNDRQHNHREAT